MASREVCTSAVVRDCTGGTRGHRRTADQCTSKVVRPSPTNERSKTRTILMPNERKSKRDCNRYRRHSETPTLSALRTSSTRGTPDPCSWILSPTLNALSRVSWARFQEAATVPSSQRAAASRSVGSSLTRIESTIDDRDSGDRMAMPPTYPLRSRFGP